MKFEKNLFYSSLYDLTKFIADTKNSQLYICNTLHLRAIEFIDKPKETKIFLEKLSRESGFKQYFYKYDGEIKSSYEIVRNRFYFDPEITKSEKGKNIILDMFSLKKKYPNDSYHELLGRLEKADAYDGYTFDSGYEIWTMDSGEVGNMENIDDPDYDDDYDILGETEYLTIPGPFTIIDPKEQVKEEVYFEYEYHYELSWLYFKDEGFDNLESSLSLLHENIKKYGK